MTEKKIEAKATQPTCVTHPLERRKIIKRTIASLRTILVVVIVFAPLVLAYIGIELARRRAAELGAMGEAALEVAVISFLLRLFGYFSLGIVLIIAGVLIYNVFYYKFYYYDLRKDMMVVRKGVIGRTEVNTQYSRIQNVFVDQDVLDRLFKLYDVHVLTAGEEVGTTKPLNHIDGLSKQNAEYIRDFLLAKMKKRARAVL